jgi:hypothetical protein
MRLAERDGRLPGRWYLVTVVPSADEPGFADLRDWLDSALARVGPESGAGSRGSSGESWNSGGGS